jgi:hypothetical protein
MTQEFVDGILIALIPSMLVVAWLAWRAPSDEHFSDESDFPTRPLGR